MAGGGPGGPGAPGGSHNADIPEPEPEPEAGAAERSSACALARDLKRTSGDEASPENPSGDSRGPRTLVPPRAEGPGQESRPSRRQCSLFLFLFSKGHGYTDDSVVFPKAPNTKSSTSRSF